MFSLEFTELAVSEDVLGRSLDKKLSGNFYNRLVERNEKSMNKVYNKSFLTSKLLNLKNFPKDRPYLFKHMHGNFLYKNSVSISDNSDFCESINFNRNFLVSNNLYKNQISYIGKLKDLVTSNFNYKKGKIITESNGVMINQNQKINS